MFIRKMDFLSPPITLYYKGDESHTSIFAGILTIIIYLICIVFGVFYAIRFINKLNPQVYYYNRYVEDAGEFSVNSSSMFSFIQILDTEKNIPDIVDFDILNIIGIELDIKLYHEDYDLSKYNHWLYGPCNNSTDTEGIKELITFDHFTESACIRQYYDKDDKKYYDSNDKNFKWPIILHGCGNDNRTFYGIIVEKCRNTTLRFLSNNRYCKSKDEIINYIKGSSIRLQLIDHFTDMFNYKNPYRKYFYSVSNSLVEESYTTNHLNFNPSTLISDEDLFFSYNQKQKLSYLFDLNEKITTTSGNTGIYVAFYFWMQKRMQYYERVYEKIQDVLSNIGGFSTIFLTFAELINYLVNHFIILFDIQNYINAIDNSKEYDKKIIRISLNNKSKIDINNNVNNLFPPKKYNYNSNLFKDGVDIFNRKIKIIKNNQKNSACINNNSLNKNKLLFNVNNLYLNNQKTKRKTGTSFSSKYLNNLIKEKLDSRSNIVLQEKANQKDLFNKEKIILEKSDHNEKPNSDTLKFINYILYLISFKKKHSNIQLYSDFRIKMISEENLILSYLNIDKLIQKSKKEN